MSTTEEHTIESLFADALAVPTGDRVPFLRQHCADEERRAEVASLLDAYDDADGFFETLRADVTAPAVGAEYPSGPADSGRELEATTSDPLQLSGTEVGGYAVQEPIGGGGMGVVYRAWDPGLERSVALKFLPPFLAEVPAAQQRFVKEAQAAARLEHPNVATIHEIGETEQERRFIVMMHYDGETLREQLSRDGPLEPSVAAECVQTLAEALHQVHQAGIVHRDVKPANVMRTAQGTLKLLDFGLAKAAATGASVTERPLGTPGYMSPEQADEQETGPYTDVWSLGVMLYEMLTGTRPFSGDRPFEVLEAIRHDDPGPLRTHRAEVPQALASIVSTCLEKDPAERYASAKALATDLSSLVESTERDEAHSVAVLPFTHRGGSEGEVFTEGMHESIIAQLSKVSELNVKVGVPEADGAALASVADELGVRWIVKGSVVQADDHLQVAVQLFDARDGAIDWAETYRSDFTAEGLFGVQEEITRAVAEALTVDVTAHERERMTNTPTQNLNAYRLYVKGRSSLNRRDSTGLRNAVAYFRQAVQEDATYALAWTGLADAVNLVPLYAADERGQPEIDAEEAARRALELAPDLAEAHASLGYLHDLPEGRHRLQHAVDLKPSYAQAHQWLAHALLVDGAPGEAREHASIAAELAPRNQAVQGFLAFQNIAEGWYREGMSYILQHEASTEEKSEWLEETASRFLFAAFFALEQWDDAQRLIHQRREQAEIPKWGAEWIARSGMVERALGNRETARETAERLREQPGALCWGILLVALGADGAAIEAFREVETWGYYDIIELRYFYPTVMDAFRRTSHYEALLKVVEARRAPNPTAAYRATAA